MEWTGKKIGEVLGVEVPPALASVSLTGFSIDSRTLKPGQCFIAIPGPNFDGHDFARQALDRSASACIVSQRRCPGFDGPLREKLIAVPDTLEALQGLARFARRQWGRPVIGVTGSVGKTTAKEMMAAVLGTKYRVLKSGGNLNNEYGLPLSLLRLEDTHELAVLEMGMAHSGEIAKLCAVAGPNIGVVLSVVPVHLEFFSSMEEIAEAKRELVQGLAGSATAVLNADDERVARFQEGFAGKTIRFGFDAAADIRAENIEDNGLAGCAFDLVVGESRERIALTLPRQHIPNALAACAVASFYDVAPAQMREALAGFRPAPLRGERLDFEQGFTVINDAYNSNPVALRAMANALSRTTRAKRRLLVAGEMKELGPASRQLHEETGRHVFDLAGPGGIDYFAGVSGDAQHLIAGARNAGMAEDRVRFFEEKQQAADWLCDEVRPGDWILLKASRGVALESLLDSLRVRFPNEIPAGQGTE